MAMMRQPVLLDPIVPQTAQELNAAFEALWEDNEKVKLDRNWALKESFRAWFFSGAIVSGNPLPKEAQECADELVRSAE